MRDELPYIWAVRERIEEHKVMAEDWKEEFTPVVEFRPEGYAKISLRKEDKTIWEEFVLSEKCSTPATNDMLNSLRTNKRIGICVPESYRVVREDGTITDANRLAICLNSLADDMAYRSLKVEFRTYDASGSVSEEVGCDSKFNYSTR